MEAVQTWLYPTPKGLYCAPADVFIDPSRPVERALITHGHSDHARPGHGAVLATPETVAIMKARYGDESAGSFQPSPYGQPLAMGGVAIRLVPAGHILGAAQIVLDYGGRRAVVSGDYKRAADPTCEPFEPVPCDVFVTEATFALPVFRHEKAEREAERLVKSLSDNADRTHLLGVYSLGKCQRMLKLVRQTGFDQPIYLHGALVELTRLYQRFGQDFGSLIPLADADRETARAGGLVLCPPGALSDRWSRRFDDPLTACASGWMRVRARARQRGVELPLIVSDHADWPELLATVKETQAEEIWVTHGREDALVHALALDGIRARALALVGYDDEAE